MKHLKVAAASLAVAFAGAAQAQSGPIKIGVVTPFTGAYAGIGSQQVKGGIDLAVKEINEKGGILGRQVEVIYEDEETSPQTAAQKAEKLFQVAKVDFLTGSVNSGATLAIAQLAERNNRLAATSVSFSDAITGPQCSPNMFRVNARAGMQSAALVEWVVKEKPNASVYYLGPDYEMGRSTVSAFKNAAEKRGAKSVGEVFAPIDNKDYAPFFGQMRSARPQVLYTSVAGNDTVRLFNQLAEYGLNKNFQIVGASGTVTPQNLAAMGKAAEGFVTGAGYSVELDTAENKAFVGKFRQAMKQDPDLFGVDSYGVVYFYKAAVEKAKSTDTDKVRAAARGIEWDTPQGRKQMRAGDHQAIQDMYVVKVLDGKFKIISKVSGSAAIGPDTCDKF